MKKLSLSFFLAFNFILSLSAMEQANIKKDSETVLVVLKHYRRVTKCKFRELKNYESSEGMTLEQIDSLKKATRGMIQNLQKTSDVYSLFPELYYAYAYLTDEHERSGKVSTQTLDKFRNNLGKLTLINIRNEADKKINIPSQHKSDYEFAVEALMKKYHLSSKQK